MSNKTLSKVADPYARALFEIARNGGQLQEYLDDIEIVKEVFSEYPDLITYLENPFYDNLSKRLTLLCVFLNQDHMSENGPHIKELKTKKILSFIWVLLERKRISLVLPMCTRFKELCDELVGIKDALCYSASALTPSQEKELVTALINRTGYKEIRLTVKIDRSLLGGLQVVIDSNLIDVSLRGRLSSLFEKMAS
jgi:F-type H+-transporting ATPase subunit delta